MNRHSVAQSMVAGVEGAGSSYPHATVGPNGVPATPGQGGDKIGAGGSATSGATVNALVSGAGGVAGYGSAGREHATSRTGGRSSAGDPSDVAAAVGSNGGSAASTVAGGSRGTVIGATGGARPGGPDSAANRTVDPAGAGAVTLPDNNAVASAIGSGADTSTSQSRVGADDPGCTADGSTGDTGTGSHC